MTGVDARALHAAHNNAVWCDAVCRTHGVATAFHSDAWVAATRTPPMYPDAVTLARAADPRRLLARVDASPGCSVKDSFASVDLSGAGMRVLFEAEWVHRPPATAADRAGGDQLRWRAVRTADDLHAWAGVHGGGEVFRPGLLTDPDVVVLSAHADGALAGGVVANRSGPVVGVSNVFATTDPERLWHGIPAAVAAYFPGLPLVGYEGDEGLTAAARAGFVAVGRLRVWIAD